MGVMVTTPHCINFNPRTPRGVRPASSEKMKECTSFQSTHPARGATRCFPHPIWRKSFQSTHPARGATPSAGSPLECYKISIHAPREGCDKRREQRHYCEHYFNPRTPRGVRRGNACFRIEDQHISIHAPREGCDCVRPADCGIVFISIHAPREGCDFVNLHSDRAVTISIHAPREGCDSKNVQISLHIFATIDSFAE